MNEKYAKRIGDLPVGAHVVFEDGAMVVNPDGQLSSAGWSDYFVVTAQLLDQTMLNDTLRVSPDTQVYVIESVALTALRAIVIGHVALLVADARVVYGPDGFSLDRGTCGVVRYSAHENTVFFTQDVRAGQYIDDTVFAWDLGPEYTH